MGTGAAGFSGCWPLAAHTLAGNDGLSRLGRRCTTVVERLDCAPEGIVLSFVELLHQWQLAEIRHAAYPPSSCLSCRFCLDKLEATAYRASLRESLTEEASDLKSHRNGNSINAELPVSRGSTTSLLSWASRQGTKQKRYQWKHLPPQERCKSRFHVVSSCH